MAAETVVYFGPPGTGKTATLLARAREEIDRGTPPDRTAFVAFSRRAAREARGRATAELGLDADDLRHWRTLHSTAARELGVGDRLMDRTHWDRLGEILGLELGDLDESGRPMSFRRDLGHVVQSTYYIRRAVGRSMALQALIVDHGERVGLQVDRFSRTMAAYKEHHGLMDYADLIEQAQGELDADVVLIDEAQDLTPAQWAYADRLVARARRVYVAGDDDQAVYAWAGADVTRFLALTGERVVLRESYRLPRAAHSVALSLLDRIRTRQPKTWGPRDLPGTVEHGVPAARVPVESGEWLLLARTQRALGVWEVLCRSAGVRYISRGVDSVRPDEVRAIRAWEVLRSGRDPGQTALEEALVMAAPELHPDPTAGPIWHKALVRIPVARRRYYESCLRRDRRALDEPARVRISTIHGAKGAEAPNVAVLPDITPRIARGMRTDPDAEHRVWYVAATRVLDRLIVSRPDSDLYYSL